METAAAVLAYLKTHLYLLAIPVALLFLLWTVHSKRKKRRKQQEEMRQLQRRNEALNEALRNPRLEKKAAGHSGPMKIAWDEQAADSGEKHRVALMMELVERSAYARRTYVFPAGEPVSVGSGGDNVLLLSRDGVAENHCIFFLRGKKPCVRTVSGAKATLTRGRETAIVSEGGIYLNNEDIIHFGSTEIQFRLFKA